MSEIDRLKSKIHSKNCTIGIIGLGYVGLPLAIRFGDSGYRVLGFDVDTAKVQSLNRGKSYINHIPSEQIKALADSRQLEATSDFGRLPSADAIIICVPTPLTEHREPDLQYVESTAKLVAMALRPGQLVILESTTYPGTTDEVLLPMFTAGGLKPGEDIFLAFSPEREDPGNQNFTTATIPKVVGGITPACLDLGTALYSQVVSQVIPVSSTRAAEATKILENTYRAVNIALVNELKVAFQRMGIDIWEVISAAKSKPFGYQAFYPGPGLGGHCIPIDPFYLTWKAREYGIATRFIELAGEINTGMPHYVVERLADALNDQSKALKGSRVLVLGVAYKKDVDDMRESPALEIMELLLSKGATVQYSDPFFPRIPSVRRHALNMESVDLSAGNIREFDAVFLITDHSNFPYELIYESAALIVDSRNAFAQRGLSGPKIVRA